MSPSNNYSVSPSLSPSLPPPSLSPSLPGGVQGVVVVPLPGSRAAGGGDEAVQETRARDPEGSAETGTLPVQQGEERRRMMMITTTVICVDNG